MNTGSDLTIVVPIYLRTKNIERMLASVQATVPDAEVLFVVTSDDPARRELPSFVEVDGWAGQPGDWSLKQNFGYRCSSRPFIFTGADDIVFREGWYDACHAVIADGIGVVGTVDDLNGRTLTGDHSTHSLVARWYANDPGGAWGEPGGIFHTGYVHEYADDELVQVAKLRGAYAHAFDAHVSHIHMLADASLDDDTYRHGRSRTPISRTLYRRRSRLWRR